MLEAAFVAFIIVDIFKLEVSVKAFVECGSAFLGYHQVQHHEAGGVGFGHKMAVLTFYLRFCLSFEGEAFFLMVFLLVFDNIHALRP